MCTPFRCRARRARPTPGIPRRHETPEHTAGDAPDAQAGDIVESVWLVGEDRGCRPQPAADGGTDALAEVARGETCRVAGEEGVVAPHDFHVAAQVVAEATRIVLRPWREPPLEGGDEVPPVRTDILTPRLQAIGDGAHSDIQPAALLRHVPGIT